MTQASKAEKNLRFIGKWIATPTFAIGSGITTTVAASSIGFIASLALPWMMVVLASVFLAETAVSIYFFKNAVPDTLVACFIHNMFRGLGSIKKALLGFGIFAALGSGLAFAALTFVSSTAAMSTILGLLSFSCPPLGLVFASVLGISAIFCLTCLFVKHIEIAIKNDIHLKILQFFKTNFSRDLEKPLMQQVLEVSLKLFFILSIVIMTIIGTIATLGTMQGGLASFLSLIPQADVLAVKISSSIIAYGLMGLARTPWLLSFACRMMSSLGGQMGKNIYQIGLSLGQTLGLCPTVAAKALPEAKPNASWKSAAASFLKISAALIHGFSFGALARSGGGHVVSDLMQDLALPLNAANMAFAGETAALVTQGTVQAAISMHAFFGEKKEAPSPAPAPSRSRARTMSCPMPDL